MDKKSIPSDIYSENKFYLRSVGAYDYAKFIKSYGKCIPPRFQRLLKIADIEPGIRILDIGCGRGELVTLSVQQNVFGIGVDYAFDSMKFCLNTRDVLLNGEKGELNFACSNAKMLPFKDKSFDRIFIIDVVEHLYNWEAIKMLKEVKRVLTSSGFAIIHTLPNRWAIEYGYPAALRVFGRLKRTPRDEIEHESHVNEQDILHLADLIEKANLHHKIWLESLSIEQAVWRKDLNDPDDYRQGLYSILRSRPLVVLYRLINLLPLKLFFYNDVFAIIWRKHHLMMRTKVLPNNTIEQICILLLRLLAKKGG